MDFPSLCACSESNLKILFAENTKRILCTWSKNWTFPEVVILGTDQKEHSLWVYENDQEGEIVEYPSVLKEWLQKAVLREGWRVHFHPTLNSYFTIYLVRE